MQTNKAMSSLGLIHVSDFQLGFWLVVGWPNPSTRTQKSKKRGEEGRLPAAPLCPRTEAYLEECGPQRALDRLRAALDASEAEAEAQMQRFLAHEVAPRCPFRGRSFCRSRARSHVSRTQLEKLQELLQMGQDPAGETPGLNPAPDRGAASPKALELRCGFVPAVLVPAAAIVPFAVPPKHRLPALGQPPVAPHATPLSPRPFRHREPEPLQP
ncbi:uncharacterized protein LOC116217362 [Meleagris gallopavo]|uniref:uncharacterized protein LOC116217362 n=1 Tax=Meleagris gallopavo TaxID=9103 RepID=UPI0012AB70B0|nr:uncharacterized protein LOC116217362 [Meleagris gallopavo]